MKKGESEVKQIIYLHERKNSNVKIDLRIRPVSTYVTLCNSYKSLQKIDRIERYVRFWLVLPRVQGIVVPICRQQSTKRRSRRERPSSSRPLLLSRSLRLTTTTEFYLNGLETSVHVYRRQRGVEYGFPNRWKRTRANGEKNNMFMQSWKKK